MTGYLSTTFVGANNAENVTGRAGGQSTRLLGPAGQPLALDPVSVARRLEQMVTITGEPLFPHVDAGIVGEDEDFLSWQRTAAWQRWNRVPSSRMS